MGFGKLRAQRQKVQDMKNSVQQNVKVGVQWKRIKECVLHTVSGLLVKWRGKGMCVTNCEWVVGKVERKWNVCYIL